MIAWSNVVRTLSKATIAVVSVAALGVAVAWLSGAFVDKIEPDAPAAPRRMLGERSTAEVREVENAYVEEAIGALRAASRSAVAAKILATIEQVHVAAGDRVEVDELLVQLDSKALEARLRQAEEALRAAAAARREAEQSFGRAEQLLAQQAISPQEHDAAIRNLEVAQAEEQRAREAAAEAAIQRSYADIRAPQAGRIVDRLAEPGDTARPGEPLLTLYDETSLRLEAPVLEHLALGLVPGQTLQVRIDALDRQFEATVDEIVPQADAPSRSFLVKVRMPADERLFEGMFGRVEIPAGQRRRLCVPAAAVVRMGQLQYVDVAMDDGALERRLITTGRAGEEDRVEVLSGVKAGEQVALPPPVVPRVQ
jgi:RND family efflux transporter MFP subunit